MTDIQSQFSANSTSNTVEDPEGVSTPALIEGECDKTLSEPQSMKESNTEAVGVGGGEAASSNLCSDADSASEHTSRPETNAAGVVDITESSTTPTNAIPKEILVLDTVKSLTSVSVSDEDADTSFEDTIKSVHTVH